jgi:DNA-binding transcriptional MerR regulator
MDLLPSNGLPLDDPRAPLYSVGQVASMLNVQQAFLRRLDTHDIVSPARSDGQQRRYSRSDIEDVQEAVGLIGEGLTLGGVRRVLDLQDRVRALEQEVQDLRDAQAGSDRPGTSPG